MIPSQNCIDLCKKSEGLRLKPYLDKKGIPTIGYGTTYYEDGSRVTLNDPEITPERAESLLLLKLQGFGNEVLKLVTVPLNQNQFDALTDFTYNLGPGNLATSHLLIYLNEGKYQLAANEFPKWDHCDGEVLEGLLERRLAEKALFLS